MEVNCYHVKGLDREIDLYHHSKYQMNSKNKSSEQILSKLIRKHDRHIKLKIEHRPYLMGSKKFVLVKLIEAEIIQSPNK